MKSGIELIAEERRRQVTVEGWSPSHDAQHSNGELATAAACYASPVYIEQEAGVSMLFGKVPIPKFWPWETEWWKPTPDDRIRELVKAGALIAAEIDRLKKVQSSALEVSCTGKSCICSAPEHCDGSCYTSKSAAQPTEEKDGMQQYKDKLLDAFWADDKPINPEDKDAQIARLKKELSEALPNVAFWIKKHDEVLKQLNDLKNEYNKEDNLPY